MQHVRLPATSSGGGKFVAQRLGLWSLVPGLLMNTHNPNGSDRSPSTGLGEYYPEEPPPRQANRPSNSSYGVRNYGGSPTATANQQPLHRPSRGPLRGYEDLDDSRMRLDQELYELEEQKKAYNNNFNRFLQKKEEFLDKVEQFEADREAFEQEKRRIEQMKKNLEDEMNQFHIEKQQLAEEREAMVQQRESISKEQKELVKQHSLGLEKNITQANPPEGHEDPQKIDQLTIQIDDMKNQIESQNQTHLILQQVIDSLTLQLQTEAESGEKLKAEIETVKSNKEEWKKKEKKLKSQIKVYKESMDHFIREREQLNKDREAFEKSQLSLAEADSPSPTPREERWEDKAWLQQEAKRIAQDRQKVAVIKRYTETERQRVGELKKRIEAEQTANDLLHQELTNLKANQASFLGIDNNKKSRPKSPKPKDKLPTEVCTVKSPRKTESHPISPRPQKTMQTLTSPRSKKSPEKKEDEKVPEAPQSSQPPPGDVFQITQLPLFTLKPEIVAKIFLKGEEEDFQTLEAESDGLITKASLRCCLRRVAALPNDYDFHFTFFTIHDYVIDSVTLFKTLILLYRSGITPLITRQAAGYTQAQSKTIETQLLHKYQDRVIEALVMWMGFRFENLTLNQDFRAVLNQFFSYLENPSINQNHVGELRKAWNYLEEMSKQFNDGKLQLFKLATGPPNGLTILQIPPKTMAEQLTLEEQAIFQNIELTDYYQKSWETNPNNNIGKMMERFDLMANWFSSLILSTPNEFEQERAAIISKTIQVMTELKDLRNFNSMMQIFTALNSEHIQRLKKAWALVPKNDIQLFQRVSQFMSPNDNFVVYRAYLDEIKENSPCIPYHALLLRDLHVIESLSALYDEQGRIHFDTMAKLSDVFYRLQDFRSVLYSLEQEVKVQIFLSNKQVLSAAEIGPSYEALPRAKSLDPDALWYSLVPGSTQVANFSKWLTNGQEKLILECWGKLVTLKQTNFDQTALGHISWQETGEQIITTYFEPDSLSFIQQDFPHLEAITGGFISSSQVVPDIANPLIDYCASLLALSWNNYVSQL